MWYKMQRKLFKLTLCRTPKNTYANPCVQPDITKKRSEVPECPLWCYVLTQNGLIRNATLPSPNPPIPTSYAKLYNTARCNLSNIDNAIADSSRPMFQEHGRHFYYYYPNFGLRMGFSLALVRMSLESKISNRWTKHTENLDLPRLV